MNKLKIVTVLRSGPSWPAEYVYNFKKGVDKNITIPYEFICLSDIPLSVKTLPLNNIGKGFWTKLQMFRPELQLTGPCLYFDLDTVIVDNLDEMISAFIKYDFLMLEDPWIPGSSSSAMMWWQGDYSRLWSEYLTKHEDEWGWEYRSKKRYGDQAYIMERVNHSLIQKVIPDPNSIIRYSPKASKEGVKIWQFGSAKLKPWLFLDDPMISKNWA